ncbi:sorting nexin-25 isoform X2 [Rhincodon typus]|uniref:sorting nexin-25 isoform X2 n=1 Tax=Rhincodon typus TaxID=259920 RepID=UPI00202E953C|nr:sorting nexin-25 isoform X2 [Rhincodon typus]
MSLKQLLAGVLFVAPFIYWSPSLLLDVSPLLLLAFSWRLLDAPATERNRDELNHSLDPRDQGLPERTAEVNQPHDHVDAIDGRVLDPALRQSLRKVFECSYSQFILLWYNPPEPRTDQPLYQVLLHEFNLAVDHAVSKILNLDLTRIEIELIRRLTNHLHTAKKRKERGKMFQTRQEEVSFLREAAETLIGNLLPDSLWKLNTYQQVLKEVVALKVLEEVINTVCDVDFINQTLIKFLDKDSDETKEVEDVKNPSPKMGTKNEINIPKANKKKKWSKKDEVDGQSCSEHEDVDQNFRSFPANVSNLEDSIDDSAEEDGFKFHDEMLEWLKENSLIPSENEETSLRNCKITISKVLWDEIKNPTCIIDVENLEVAEECWSVQRKYHEFENLQKELSKTFNSLVGTRLPSIKPDITDSKFKEDIECQLNGFLKKLVSEESILQNESTRKFFSANDQLREYWGLLKSLFNEDDEVICTASDTSEGPRDTDVDEDEPLETAPENAEMPNRDSAESLPSEMFSENSEADCGFRCMSGTSKKKVAGGTRICRGEMINRPSQKKVQRTTEQTGCLTDQLQELLEELLCTEDYRFNKVFLTTVLSPLLTYKRKFFEKKLDQFFSKEQIVLYVDCLRETLWPNGKPAEPLPERSLKEKTIAKERAEELLQEKASGFIYSVLHGKKIVKLLFPIFQDAETNKTLVYNVLKFLLSEITAGNKGSLVT